MPRPVYSIVRLYFLDRRRINQACIPFYRSITNIRPGSIRYRGRREVASPAFTDHEILAAFETSLLAQAEADAVIGSHMRLVADKNCEGHFNVLRGNIAPTNTADIETVVDIGNNRQELPTVFVDLDR